LARIALNGEDIGGPALPWEQISMPESFWNLVSPLLAPSVSVIVVPDHVAPANLAGRAP